MAHRYLPLASFLGALLFSGCVIYTEPNGQNQGNPPPPPPPPHRGQPQNQPPPNQPPKETVSGKLPSAQPQPQPKKEDSIHGKLISKLSIGKLHVVVVGGTCEIGIDGKSQGVSSKVTTNIGAGDHEVTCQPTGGKLQTQAVSVAKNEEVVVSFDLNNPANTTNVSKPMNVAPPVGRPTPGQ